MLVSKGYRHLLRGEAVFRARQPPQVPEAEAAEGQNRVLHRPLCRKGTKEAEVSLPGAQRTRSLCVLLGTPCLPLHPRQLLPGGLSGHCGDPGGSFGFPQGVLQRQCLADQKHGPSERQCDGLAKPVF